MKILDLIQGTDAWDKHRSSARNASAASCVLNFNPKTSRQEYLRICAGFSEKEISEWVQKNLFDKGHEVEDAARPVVADIIGEVVYPITATSDDGYLSASFDGVTMDESTIWENKLFNQDLYDYIKANNDLPDTHWPQVEQQIMVSKADQRLFTLSDRDGNVKHQHWYISQPARQAQIMAAWQQFDVDLANYQHVEVKAEATGKAPDALPALRIEVTGMVTASNLAEFKAHSLAVFAGINKDLQTDEDFATAEKTVKWCGDVESRLEAAKEHALSQTQSIDELFKTIDAISAEARRVRLDLDKQVKAQKENRRADIVNKAKVALFNHVSALNTRLGKNYMPVVISDFPGVIKGKKTIISLQDAADAELARCKILANEIADNIQINLNTLRDMASDYKTLFSDAATIVLKNNDDLVALVKSRISDHEKELADKKERERIEAEMKATKLAEMKEREQAAIQNMRAQEASEGKPSVPVQPAQEVKPVIAQPVKMATVAATSQAAIAFNAWWDSIDVKYRNDIVKDAVSNGFINGYNIGKRHGLDEK